MKTTAHRSASSYRLALRERRLLLSKRQMRWRLLRKLLSN